MQLDMVDFLVVGAGLCGLSVGAALSPHGRVVVLEQEDSPCYHSSGRSAAIFARNYGSDAIRQLTYVSEPLYERARVDGLFDALAPSARGIMFVAGQDAGPPVAPGPGQTCLSGAEVERIAPLLPAGRIAYGLWDDSARDIDVHAMQLGYARLIKDGGGAVITACSVTAARPVDGGWMVEAGGRQFQARLVVNAAGAWADAVAGLFGARPVGLEPRRRSAALIDPPVVAEGSVPFRDWPLVFDIGQTVYFKPEAGKLMLSPVDATPVPPHDCWAEDMDIATAVDRFERLTGHEVRRVSHSWAGLRSFTPDEDPVIGFDPQLPGFLWLAGLGGSGIKTAPATGAMAAALALGRPLPAGLSPELVSRLSPARFAALEP